MSKILVKAKTNVILMERQIRYNINYIRSLRAVGLIFTLFVPLIYGLCVLTGVLPLEYQAMGELAVYRNIESPAHPARGVYHYKS